MILFFFHGKNSDSILTRKKKYKIYFDVSSKHFDRFVTDFDGSNLEIFILQSTIQS